jgi:hypothetical protein
VKLYKYRDFSNPSEEHFLRLDTMLRREAFWCARPDTLNDPEEFAWKCDSTASAATEELLAALLVRVKGRPHAEARERSAAAISTGRLEALAKPIFEGMIQKCRAEIGLVCFGTSPDNAVLWERYAGNGAGLCVELEVPAELLEKQLYRVQYSFERLIHIDQLMRASLALNHVREVYTLALLSKPSAWAAEEEIRYVSRRQEVLVHIDGSHITRLVFGGGLKPAIRHRLEDIAAALRHDVQEHENVA